MAYEKIKSHEEYLKIAERYQNCKPDAYKSMSFQEKIDFFAGVYTDIIQLWDENGDELATWKVNTAIWDEFLSHPEQFSLEDIHVFMEMLDDSCYHPSSIDTVDTIAKIIHNIACFYQLEGVAYLLSHLQEVPERGRMIGWPVTLYLLIRDGAAYAWMKEALKTLTPDALRLLHCILGGEGLPKALLVYYNYGSETELARKAELEEAISRLLR